MDIDKLFESESLDGIADNVFGVVNNSVSEVKEMQRKKVAENVQLVVNALKKIESDISSRYDSVGNALEKRIITIKDGRDGADGRDGRNGKDGKNGRDGAPGPRGADGKNGLDGADGTDGVSVTNAHIDFDGSLVISLSSGQELNVGEVVAPALAEQIKVITNGGGTSQSVIDTLASLQAQITALGTAASYKGLWNASTNTPTLTSSVGTSGNFYIVSVAGSTNLDGITNWGVGDWAIYNGTAWQRVEGGAAGNFTTVTASSLTSGRVTYAGTAGLLQDSANLTFNGTTLTANTIGAFTLSGTVAGGGNQLNNVIIGTTTPLAGAFTSLTASTTLTVTGAGSIQGLTVGRGAGAVIGNTVLGASALVSNLTSTGITAVGYVAGQDATAGDYSTYIGYLSGQHTLGANNTAVGSYALNNLSGSGGTGTYNAAFGRQALYSNTSGSYNTALGASALQANLAADYNTAVGYQAGQAITSGSSNTAIGYQANKTNISGNQVTAVGSLCLASNTAANNTAVGFASMNTNISGSGNTALGWYSLYSNTTASGSTAVGYQAGYTNTGIVTAFGYRAGYSQTTNSTFQNSFFGYEAGFFATGAGHTAVGQNALRAMTSANWSTAVGYGALAADTGGTNTAVGANAAISTTGAGNSVVGYLALNTNISGTDNVAIGANALFTTTAGSQVAVGSRAAYARTTATGETYASTFIGTQAGSGTTSGIELTFIGGFAGRYHTGNYNTAVGTAALYGASGTSTGTSNTALGYVSLFSNTSGSTNVALGGAALYSNTTASNNTAVGYQALYANTTGAGSTALGYQAGYSSTTSGFGTYVGTLAGYSTTAASNTCIGYWAGRLVTTGTHNVLIGEEAGEYTTAITTGSQNVIVGDYSYTSSAAATNQYVFGYYLQGKGNSTAYIGGSSGAYNQANSLNWSVTSDQRLKKNIVDNNIGLEKITAIRVRNFEYRLPEEVDAELKPTDAIKKEGVQLGVIAQELQMVLPDCVKTESTGVMSVNSDALMWHMINAIKELSAKVTALENK